ncbi:MAG: VCBS repeat-containing protein [Planctomycetes bacterium]|nr:VCBS repeat-containing protein [Planctomycetota bacterium]
MFLTPCDLDRDGRVDVAVAVRGGDLLYFRCERLRPLTWRTWPIHMPPGTGTGKAVAAGDLNLDGRVDLVVSCENARGRSGVFWLSWRGSVFDAEWDAHEISGREEGTKYDLVRLIDLDEDGDLDVLTCEERDNLGVIWYENPTR